MIVEDFSPNFTIHTAAKDLQLAMALAQELELDLPVLQQVTNVFNQALQQGGGLEDGAAVIRCYQDGHRVTQ